MRRVPITMLLRDPKCVVRRFPLAQRQSPGHSRCAGRSVGRRGRQRNLSGVKTYEAGEPCAELIRVVASSSARRHGGPDTLRPMAPRPRSALLCVLVAAAAGSSLSVAAAAPPSVGPCPTLPADNVWNTDISSLPVHPRSVAWIASSGGASRPLPPDWGPPGGPVAYGIPWQGLDGGHQKGKGTLRYPH